MSASPFEPDRFFKSACLFESGLLLVAVILGWLAGINPFADLNYQDSAIFFGVVGTIPLFLLYLLLQHVELESVIKIRILLQQILAPGLMRCHWGDLFILAAIAGISEEVLFRGFMQPWLESIWNYQAGLVVSNLIFGLVHSITPLYTVLATLVGIYLGLALDFGGERNLLIPILIHGLYDFLAFVALMRAYRLGATL